MWLRCDDRAGPNPDTPSGPGPDAIKADLISNVAFSKRFGHADEFASLVEAILKTPFLNGQTIRLDGALSTPLTSMAVTPAQA